MTMTTTIKQWQTRRLGELAEFRNGVNYDKRNFGRGVKIVGVRDFQDYIKPNWTQLDEINPRGVVAEGDVLQHDDILFVRSNGNRDLIGRSLYIDNPTEEVTHSAFTIRLRFISNDVYPRFYAYLFRTPFIRKSLTASGSGTNISNLNQMILSQLQVPQPPLSVQHKVAAILSAYDDLIENNNRRIKILEEMAQAIYREWFVSFRFPGHENGKMADSSLGRIPERWEAVTLRDVTRYINRGISPIYDDNSDTLVLNQRCIRDGKINPELSRKQSKQVPQEKFVQFGDVLINSTGVGTLGRVAQLYETVENCTVDSHVTIARANKRVNLDYFGFHLLGLQHRFEHSGTGTTGQTELSRETIANCDFLLPSMDLQNSFSDTVSGMRQAIAIMARANSNLRATRDLLLPRLISGEVDVSKLDAEEVTAPA